MNIQLITNSSVKPFKEIPVGSIFIIEDYNNDISNVFLKAEITLTSGEICKTAIDLLNGKELDSYICLDDLRCIVPNNYKFEINR